VLRHFFASSLIRAGASIKQVQEALGHRSATLTLDVYGHLFPGDEDRTRAAIDGALGPSLRSAPRGVDPVLTREDLSEA
jgi:integrase